jgi:lysophospholipase L1-like esterase
VFGGTNDIFGGLPITDTVKNIHDIIDIIIQHGARPHVIVGYDTDETWQKDKLSPTTWGLKSMDDILKVKQRYIEYQKALTDNIKNAKLINFKLGKGMTYDGVHPNLEGSKIIAGTILDIINKGL